MMDSNSTAVNNIIDITANDIYNLCEQLYPIMRSLTGDGNRETLKILQNIVPSLKIHEVQSGSKVYDWTVPKEWNIREAFIKDSSGKIVIDLKNHNLHILNYSTPVHKKIKLEELQEHLYSLPETPDLIPYVTSYYKERWGFCLTHNDRMLLTDDEYEVYIDSDLKDGSMSYGEILIKGDTDEEIFLSTYICHPQMANNEISGPAVTIYLAKWLLSLKKRRYSYRIIFIPETIGSITYISKNIDIMQKNIVAGFILTCVGDNLVYSYIPSRKGDTLADKVALKILSEVESSDDAKICYYSYLDRGSDERQYNSPNVALPVCSVTRSIYGNYREYHTSDDNLDFISADGLFGSLKLYQNIIHALENNYYYKATQCCEPHMSKHGLYPDISYKNSALFTVDMMNFLAYTDGTMDLIDINNMIGSKLQISKLIGFAEQLESKGLIVKV